MPKQTQTIDAVENGTGFTITAETESYMVHRGGDALYRFAGTAWTSGSAACVANIKD